MFRAHNVLNRIVQDYKNAAAADVCSVQCQFKFFRLYVTYMGVNQTMHVVLLVT